MTKEILAPAKINLYLDVTGKRQDGYHNIKSVMQTVSLFDRVTVTEDTGISVSCTDKTLPTDNNNLAYKAASLFFSETGIKGGAKTSIEKNIPVAGGLAGGSTDGAAVLTALNSIYGNVLSDERLMSLGARLGADVPFCIAQGCALCEGIGELITPIESKLALNIVIAKGGESVSTPEAYRLIDEQLDKGQVNNRRNGAAVLEAVRMGNTAELLRHAYNIFEEVILPRHSCAAKIKEEMYENGAVFAMMSGSGPSVFGVFENEASACLAAQYLRSLGYTAASCKTVY